MTSRHSRIVPSVITSAAVAAALLVNAGLVTDAHAQSTTTAQSGSTNGGANQVTTEDDGLPILLKADEVTQDRELGIIVARGSVEVARGKRILLADTLSYNQNARTVTASGNVTILEPGGEVVFADYVELSEDLRDGTIENLRILLSDNARIVANGGRRRNGNVTEMARAVYSPCEVCRENPEKAPLWQIKANRIVHDQAKKKVEYYDTVLEMAGIPILYTPYFTHPDPTVERESGFLTPSFGSSTNTGVFYEAPYFWAIADDKDLTIAPIFTEKQIGFLSGEYRQAFDTGYFDVSGSFTVADRVTGTRRNAVTETDEFRGHIKTTGEFHPNETVRWGWEAERTTDKTYYRKFDFFETSRNSLTSRAYVEGFRQRNYASAEAFSFQDLRLGQRPDTPLVLPLITYSGLGETDRFGGRWSLDANVRGLSRGDGADSQRISVEGGYRKEFIADAGLATSIETTTRGDIYNVNQESAVDAFGRELDDGVASRASASLGVEVRYPFVRHSVTGRQVIEPIFGYYGTASTGNPADIPNDESGIFEADDTNLVELDRLPGLDRIEPGHRVVGGLKASNYLDNGGRISLFLGQAYRLSDDRDLELDTNISSGKSDIVGRLEYAPMRYFDTYYRFNYDPDESRMTRSELNFRVGSGALGANTTYTFVDNSLSRTGDEVEEIVFNAYARFDDNWKGHVSTVRDLVENEPIRHRLSVTYEDECLIFTTAFQRRFTSSADVEEDETILFNVTFKTLGEAEF